MKTFQATTQGNITRIKGINDQYKLSSKTSMNRRNKNINKTRLCLTIRCSEIEPHGAFWAGDSLRFSNQFIAF